MRLIDADAIPYEPLPKGDRNYRTYNLDDAYEDGYNDAMVDVRNAPTIEERKKGKWILKDNPGTGWYRVTCSECGEDVTSTAPCIGFFPNAKVIWDFCPYCGARMSE